jgi:hypothetical protein
MPSTKHDVGEANTAWSTTNGREPPPTHLADVLGGFRIDSREGSRLKQLECSTKKLMLSKTKLGEDTPAGSLSESVPTSDELDHGALVADPARFHGLVAVTGAPPSRAGMALLLHRRLPFSESVENRDGRACVAENRRSWLLVGSVITKSPPRPWSLQCHHRRSRHARRARPTRRADMVARCTRRR